VDPAQIEQLLSQVTSVTPVSIAVVALAGLVVGISPGSLPLMSVAAGFAAAPDDEELSRRRLRGLWLATAFASGIVTVDMLMGALFGVIGHGAMRLLVSLLVPTFALLAALLLAMGLALLRIIRIPIPMLTPTRHRAGTITGAYFLGLPFGLSTCPACTPLIFPIVMAAAATGDPLTGAVLMATFGIFRGLPIVAIGATTGLLKHAWRTWRLVQWFERVGGALLVAASLYFLYQALLYAGWIRAL
jgi:cytochrome c-type biogenesis protein